MRALLAGMAAAMLLTGCSQAVVGEAVEAKLFDPCTELPDTVLRKAGVRPDMKADAVQFEDWKICGWLDASDEDRSMTVYATSYRLSDFRANPTKSDFRDLELGSRKVMQYKQLHSRNRACVVGVDTASGSVHVEAAWLTDVTFDTCAFALEQASILLPHLPD